MSSLLGAIHFWSSRESQFIADSDIGFYNYHGKGPPQHSSVDNYNEEFKTFCEERGVHWYLNNKRPEKLRENLKEAEELLASYRCVYCEWRGRNVLQMMLNNGAIIKIWMRAGVGDVSKIRIDKYLVGKLASDHVVDVIFLESSILVSYVEAKLTLVQLSKKFLSKDSTNTIQFEKLSSLDPKMLTVDLNGPNRRRFERRLSPSIQNDQLMVWWMAKNEEMPGPWAPPSTDKEKSNLHVYNINRNELQLACYTRTKCDPIGASFSRLHLHQIHTVEQSVKEGGVSVTLCVYHVSKSKLLRTSVTTIPLNSAVVCHRMNHTEDRTLLGCRDCSLVMYDAIRRTTHIIQGGFIPSVIDWHPSGAVVVVGSDKGHLQCYDVALNVMNLQLLNESPNPKKAIDLTSFFKSTPAVQKLIWNPLEYSPLDWTGHVDNTHSLLIYINNGPLGVMVFEGGVHNRGSLTAIELITQYIKFSQFDEAISLLLSINWNIDSDLCFKCTTLIVVSLLKLPLNESREVQLELTLGGYYSASYQLSDVVTLEYHHKMTCLARRFFHHLLRNERFEKAFLLAVDIGARDLFMDIYYIAKDKNERVLSQAALDRANQLETGSDSSLLDDDDRDSYSSTCSSSSGNSSSYSSCSNHTEELDPRTQHQQSKVQWKEIPSQQQQQQQHRGPVTPSNWSPHRTENNFRDEYSNQASSSPNQPSTSSYTRASDKAPQVMSDISEEISEEEEIHGTVRVVHFGIV